MARLRAKLDQAVVAERLGTHRVQVSKWERGVNRPGEDTIARLATLYDTTTNELLSNTEKVSRETVRASGDPDRRIDEDLDIAAKEIEIDIMRSGFPDHIKESLRYALKGGDLATMFRMGFDGRILSAEEERRKIDNHLAKVRGLLRLAMDDAAKQR
jgi:transcriptional regulator with XRE-family HTH domain